MGDAPRDGRPFQKQRRVRGNLKPSRRVTKIEEEGHAIEGIGMAWAIFLDRCAEIVQVLVQHDQGKLEPLAEHMVLKEHISSRWRC